LGSDCDVESSVSVKIEDVLSAISKLKTDKCDGNFVLYSNHFLNGCNELALHIYLLFSAMLVHGYAAGDMSSCTLIPIPKGKNAYVTGSGNYRVIALSSVFGKVFDLIFLNKFRDCLLTSTQQFGFKAKHSTSMCTMVLKETLAYYTEDGGAAFCTLLDATKVFDRINYCKLFSKLMSRNIPPAHLRLLLNMYTSSVAKVSWNGILSHSFNIVNGVRQGGIISPVLFCVCLDGLLQQLYNSGVGCFIGKVFVGALSYADDVALLAPTPSAMRKMLKICEEYGSEFSVVLNASKSVWMYVTKRGRPPSGNIQFHVDGKPISFITQHMHLGHLISANMNDKNDILNRKNAVCSKLNNLLCYFWKCDIFVQRMASPIGCNAQWRCDTVVWCSSAPFLSYTLQYCWPFIVQYSYHRQRFCFSLCVWFFT